MTEIFDDIRRLYQFKSPDPSLVDQIEFFSESSLEEMKRTVGDQPFTVRLYPSYTPTIWINLGAPYFLKNGNSLYKIDKNRDVLLLRNEIVERRNLPTDNIFTIKFLPGGFETIFGISQSELGSHILDAEKVLTAPLIRKMKNLDSFYERQGLVQQFLLDQKAKNRTNDYYLYHIQESIQVYNQSGWMIKNEEIAKKMNLTNKSLYRYFTKVIGTNPKKYFGMMRARAALQAYVKSKDSFSVMDFGYYDPGHFYKDISNFTRQRWSLLSK